MIPAVKHFDPVLGIDIHIVLVPTPAGPVPTPVPHPFGAERTGYLVKETAPESEKAEQTQKKGNRT